MKQNVSADYVLQADECLLQAAAAASVAQFEILECVQRMRSAYSDKRAKIEGARQQFLAAAAWLDLAVKTPDPNSTN